MLKYECDVCECDMAILLVDAEGNNSTRCTNCGDEEELFDTFFGIEIDPKSFGGEITSMGELRSKIENEMNGGR